LHQDTHPFFQNLKPFIRVVCS